MVGYFRDIRFKSCVDVVERWWEEKLGRVAMKTRELARDDLGSRRAIT